MENAKASGSGKSSPLAAPSVARALRDEDPAVRWVATTFFVGSGFPEPVYEGFLDQTDPKLKRRLLSDFIRAVEATQQSPMRASAIRALGYYPEEAGRVVPLLTNMLRDGDALARLIAAITLHRVDPVQARFFARAAPAKSCNRHADPFLGKWWLLGRNPPLLSVGIYELKHPLPAFRKLNQTQFDPLHLGVEPVKIAQFE
jgi:HEAT repeat protein